MENTASITQKNRTGIIRTLLVIFLAIQPILDIYMSLFDDKIQIAGVSLATVFRFTAVFALLVAVLLSNPRRKATYLFFAYGGAVVLYAVAHHINAITFRTPLPSHAQYGMLAELLYLARMCIPVALIYIIYMVRLRYRDIKTVVLASSLTVSAVIIVTNLLHVGFIAYSLEDKPVFDTMICWFTGLPRGVNWASFSCRGFFQSANQLSGVAVMLTPTLGYICCREKKIRYWILLAMQFIAMINLSTRVATVGGIAVLCGVLVIYLSELLIHKKISFSRFNLKKLCNKTVLCTVASALVIGVVLMNSPFMNRAGQGNLFEDLAANKPGGNGEVLPPEDETPEDEPPEDEPVYTEEEQKRQEMIKYVKSHWKAAEIQIFQITTYPIEDDPEFWYHLIKEVPISERYGARNMRGLMMERILERDDRVSNVLLGISHTRSSSFFWPERDFETQYDALGLVGCALFIGPYLVIAVWGTVQFLRKIKENLHLGKCVYLITVGIGLLIAYMSGHILNEIFPSVYLAMFCGTVLCSCVGDRTAQSPETPPKEGEHL